MTVLCNHCERYVDFSCKGPIQAASCNNYSMFNAQMHRATAEQDTIKSVTEAAPTAPVPLDAKVGKVLDERGARYGSFTDNSYYYDLMEAALRAATNDRGSRGQVELLPYQANAIRMIYQKISRILSGDPSYGDNWVDIAGFAELGRTGR